MIFIFDGQDNIMYSYVPSRTTCFPPADNAFRARILQRLRTPGLCGSAFMRRSTSKHLDSRGSAWKSAKASETAVELLVSFVNGLQHVGADG